MRWSNPSRAAPGDHGCIQAEVPVQCHTELADHGDSYKPQAEAAGVEVVVAPDTLDASSPTERACEHFRNVVDDIVNHNLTAADMATMFGEGTRDESGAGEDITRRRCRRVEGFCRAVR
jgi:hypothetical protein